MQPCSGLSGMIVSKTNPEYELGENLAEMMGAYIRYKKVTQYPSGHNGSKYLPFGISKTYLLKVLNGKTI